MTTQITAIREQIETKINSVLTGYRQISNPYELDKISNVILKKGYGIAFGPATNTNRLLGCKMSIEREFAIILTRMVTATEHDTQARETIEKDICEDQLKIIRAFESDPYLNDTAAKSVFDSDSGLEYLGLENSRYFVLQSSFLIEYFESLT